MLTWCSAVIMWCMSVILTGGWVMWVDCYEERLDEPVCYTQAAWSVGASEDRAGSNKLGNRTRGGGR